METNIIKTKYGFFLNSSLLKATEDDGLYTVNTTGMLVKFILTGTLGSTELVTNWARVLVKQARIRSLYRDMLST